jgi:hypothetical protein
MSLMHSSHTAISGLTSVTCVDKSLLELIKKPSYREILAGYISIDLIFDAGGA